MARLRLLIGIIGCVLLVAGYLASQAAYLSNSAAEYAAKVDRPEIVYLSLFLFMVALAFFFIPAKEHDET